MSALNFPEEAGPLNRYWIRNSIRRPQLGAGGALVRSRSGQTGWSCRNTESILKADLDTTRLYDHVGLSANRCSVSWSEWRLCTAARNRTADPYFLSGTTRKVPILSITSSTSLTRLWKRFQGGSVVLSTQLQSNTLKSNRAECRAWLSRG